MELKEKLVALRKEKGLTQSAVAEKLDVSRQAISRWESGIALPSTDNGVFHFLSVDSGSFDRTITVSERGNYTFAVRNNSSKTINVSGYVNY